VRVRNAAGGQDLDRDLAVQAGVTGTVYLAHSPGAEGRQNLVRTEACSGVERQARARTKYTFLGPSADPHSRR
jgi:hypothetical protein